MSRRDRLPYDVSAITDNLFISAQPRAAHVEDLRGLGVDLVLSMTWLRRGYCRGPRSASSGFLSSTSGSCRSRSSYSAAEWLRPFRCSREAARSSSTAEAGVTGASSWRRASWSRWA